MYKLINLAVLAYVRTPSRATCKGVLQLEATFIDVKNRYLHRDSNLVFHIPLQCSGHKARKTHGEEHVFHINVPSDGYTSRGLYPIHLCQGVF